MRLGLNYKIPAGICGLIIGVTIAIASIGDRAVLRSIESRTRKDLLEAEEIFKNFQSRRLEELMRAAAVIAEPPHFENRNASDGIDRAAVAGILESVQRVFPSDLLVVGDKEGRLAAGGGALAQEARDWMSDPVFKKALEGATVQGLGTGPKGVYQIAARPLLSGRQIVGAVLTGSVVNEAVMAEMEAATQCRITLFIGNKRVTSSSAAALWEGQEQRPAAAADPAGIRLVRMKGERHLLREIPLQAHAGNGKGRYVLAKSLDQELNFYWALRRSLLVLTSICVGVALIAGLFFSRHITGPIRLLAQGTRRVSAGDFSARVPAFSDDEIGQLASSFNQMAEGLQKTTVSKSYVDNIIGSMADALVVINPDMTIRMVNQGTLSLLGYAQEDLAGKPVGVIFHEKGERFFEEFVLEKFMLTNEIKNHRLDYRAKDGRAVPVLLSGAVMKDEAGEIISIVCVAKDITKEKEAEEMLQRTKEDLETRVKERTLQLRKVNEQLLRDIEARKATEAELMEAHKELAGREKALRDMFENVQKSYAELTQAQNRLVQSEKLASIGLLAAGIAHEIKSPVGFISSNLQVLEEYLAKYGRFAQAAAELKKAVRGGEWEKASGAAEEMERFEGEANLNFISGDIDNLVKESRSGIERIRRIVTDLRVFSREDGGAVEVADVEGIIDSVLNIVWNEIKYKAELKKDYGRPPLIRCNAQKIGQVFINLLVNASHAIENKGVIAIKTYVRDNKTCIDISDTGKGIPPQHLAKIFDPFFTTKSAGEGMGLGLSISRDIVKQHGGEITVVSQAGQGTRFTVTLPAAGEES